MLAKWYTYISSTVLEIDNMSKDVVTSLETTAAIWVLNHIPFETREVTGLLSRNLGEHFLIGVQLLF